MIVPRRELMIDQHPPSPLPPSLFTSFSFGLIADEGAEGASFEFGEEMVQLGLVSSKGSPSNRVLQHT